MVNQGIDRIKMGECSMSQQTSFPTSRNTIKATRKYFKAPLFSALKPEAQKFIERADALAVHDPKTAGKLLVQAVAEDPRCKKAIYDRGLSELWLAQWLPLTK